VTTPRKEGKLLSKSIRDKACEILRRTRDGEDLSPEHLWMVQEMVNGRLNELGEQEFEKLYQLALQGYKKPWFHGIENLTIDHAGYVFWKGKVVEHYNSPWKWSAEAKAAAEDLARRCRHLESLGVEPTTTSAVWEWEKY